MPLAGEFVSFAGRLGPGEWAILAFVPVSFVEVYLYFYLLRTAGAVFVSVVRFVSLFAGILWGMAFLGEAHPTTVWMAVALVSLALYLVTTKDRARDPAPATSGA